MRRDQEFRTRVERLLSGAGRSEDVERLFRGLRQRTFGERLVREISDFMAHDDERDRGIATDELRDFFEAMRFHMAYLDKPFDTSDVPPEFNGVLQRALDRLSSKLIYEKLGIKRKEARILLNSGLTNFYKRKDGRLYQQWKVTQEEARVLSLCAGTITVRPAFDDDALFKSFCRVLVKNGLLRPQEKERAEKFKPIVSLTALREMHNTGVKLAEDWNASLEAGVSGGKLTLFGRASIPGMPRPNNDKVFFSSAVFATSLDASQWCDSALSTSDGHWTSGIEIGSSGRLVPI